MKNLKKVLALVLVVCMAFSLVTFASAATPKVADYKDASSIKQVEAVDLFTALGVLKGIDGNFNPTANVTREQAAKIITYVLLTTASADGLKTSSSSFSDVASNRWSAASIQYGVTKGIINGMGDGTFAPEGNVTGSQFAKMLLTALGYGKNGEYTGANWEINVISDAQRLGILSLSVDVTAPATREQIAQYAFNAYTSPDCKPVNYNKNTSAYELQAQTLAVQQKVTTLDVTGPDGTPSHKWLLKGIELNGNVYAKSDVVVLGTNMTGTALSKLTDTSSSSYIAELEDSFATGATTVGTHTTIYENGTAVPSGNVAAYLAANLEVDMRKYDLGYTGTSGLIVQLVDTNNNGKADQINVTKKTVSTLTGDAIVDASGKVYVPGATPAISGEAKTKVVGYSGLKKDDVVLTYKDKDGVFHIEKAASVTGQLTQNTGIMATFGGKIYFGSGLNNGILFTLKGVTSNYNTDATIWLDNAGNIVKFKVADAAEKTYAIVVGYSYDPVGGTANAKIVKDDGTVASYAVAPGANGSITYSSISTGTLISYTITSEGKLKLTKVDNSDVVNGGYTQKTSTLPADNFGTYYLTASTKVFYYDFGSTYSDSNKAAVTTGYSATTGVADNIAFTPVLATGSTNVLAAVVFDMHTTAVGTTSKFAYVANAGASAGSEAVIDGSKVYTYSVYVDGTLVQLKSESAGLFNGFGLWKYNVDGKGYVLGDTDAPTNVDADRIRTQIGGMYTFGGENIKIIGANVVALDSGYVALDNGSTYIIDSSTKVYEVNQGALTSSVKAGTLQKTSGNNHYLVIAVLRDKTDFTSNVADEIYYYNYVGNHPENPALD